MVALELHEYTDDLYIMRSGPMQVSKWGNSLAVRIPSAVVEALGLKEGDEIEVTIADVRRFEIARDDRRAKVIARLEALKRPLPKGFRFDRDEANER